MAEIFGTPGPDEILRGSLSVGVTTNPPGVTGTLGDFNVIDAGAGDDRVEAGDYGDEIFGGDGSDQLIGGDGWDLLDGGSGNDLLIGGNGWDLLDGGTGADRMYGGNGLDTYVVDNLGDIVFDNGTTSVDDADTIITNLNYTLSETGGVECLILGDDYFGLPATRTTVYGGGNSGDNQIGGNDFANVLDGKGGNDYVWGGGGNDLVLGGAGNDDVQGGAGKDVVRGQDGDDAVYGASGADILIGGRGNDTFFFNYGTDSGPGQVDIIIGGDRAVAFENPGDAQGDVIWLPNAISEDPYQPVDFNSWSFGTGKGQISCTDTKGGMTLICGNMDNDPASEFQLLIADGNSVHASVYTLQDFVW